MKIDVLDHGYVRLVEAWGGGDQAAAAHGSDDEECGIIEAARQSTAGAFRGWDPEEGVHRGDERLLRYLYKNRHSTPFEFAGMVIEVRAPIMVFRQWHRHRTQSYNEASGRYIELPALDYMPEADDTIRRTRAAYDTKNAQAAMSLTAGPRAASNEEIGAWLDDLDKYRRQLQTHYEHGLELGIPKEVSRLSTTVGRYSQMRASANLRNWLHFLQLRMDGHAQQEIRHYANAVGRIVAETFPRTWGLAALEEVP